MRESTACPFITSGKSSKPTKEAFPAKLVGRLPCTFAIKDLGPEYEGSAVNSALVHVVPKESLQLHQLRGRRRRAGHHDRRGMREALRPTHLIRTALQICIL